MQQVMPVYEIEQVDVAVLVKVRVQREAEKAVIVPRTDFFGDIEERRGYGTGLIEYPDSPSALPDPAAAVVLERNSDSLVPRGAIGSCYVRVNEALSVMGTNRRRCKQESEYQRVKSRDESLVSRGSDCVLLPLSDRGEPWHRELAL
jgi:hypothetical protein